MRDDIREPVRRYAEGEIELQEAIGLLRQVEPAEYEAADSPYRSEADAHEGGFTDLMAACMVYDCTAEDLEHFRRAMYATKIGEGALYGPDSDKPKDQRVEAATEEEVPPEETENTFEAEVEVTKRDDRKNLVFGWANVSHTEDGQVFDHQGHAIDIEDLEDAAYNFSVKYRKTGDMHKGEGYGDLVESMVVTQDKIEKGGFPQDMLGKWWIGFKVPDEDWDRVESGERSMFSIQGRAQLEAL